jgi:serine acetyltransferase
VGVVVQEGASIGAGAVCVAPVQIGEWALVAAGSVVTRNVPNFALIAGVPGRQIGWVGKSGFKLIEKNGFYICPETNTHYKLSGEVLEEIVQP